MAASKLSTAPQSLLTGWMLARYIWPWALTGGGGHGQTGKHEGRSSFCRRAGPLFRPCAARHRRPHRIHCRVTTFVTMVYIIFVNPIILGKAGTDQGAV